MKPIPKMNGMEIELAEKSLIDGGFGKYLPKKEARTKKERDFYLFVSNHIITLLFEASSLRLLGWRFRFRILLIIFF